MARKTGRNPLFAGRWFEDEVILLCLRWYFRFKLSYRDLVEMLSERGLIIAHTTILRWVVRYAETCEKRWRRFERPVDGSWRVDETFIKVRGQLTYLYRAVDGQGNTVEFYLSRTRGIAARESILPQGTETSSASTQHHVGWTRTQSFCIAGYGNEWRVQLPRSEPRENPVLPVSKQHRRARPQAREVPPATDGRLEELLQRPPGHLRN